MANKYVDYILNRLKVLEGLGIFIEAILLLVWNIFLFGEHKSIMDLIISRKVTSPTEILAILTIFLLSIGFIYYMGYFLGAKFMKVDLKLKGGGILSELILPYGAIFILAIFIYPLMAYLSSPQLDITVVFVFLCGFINEFITQLLKNREKIQIKEFQEKI